MYVYCVESFAHIDCYSVCSRSGAISFGLTVSVNCLVKQFAMCLGVVAILLLNVMEVFSMCGGALLDRPCMVFQKCVWCACDHRVHLSVPSIGFVYGFVCQK